MGRVVLSALDQEEIYKVAVDAIRFSMGLNHVALFLIDYQFSDLPLKAQTGDFLGAGFDQLVVGWRQPATEKNSVGIRMYVPRDERGEKWDVHLIDDGGMACEDLAVGDLNGDGRLDILASGRATNNVKIYLNLGAE